MFPNFLTVPFSKLSLFVHPYTRILFFDGLVAKIYLFDYILYIQNILKKNVFSIFE